MTEVALTLTVSMDKLLAPAPMGIAVMSQLLINSSRMCDFKIDQIKKEHIPLLKHPESFRTTMVQIANDVHSAFMKAHSNMEKIKLQVAQVPDYVNDCVTIIKSNDKNAIEKLIPRRLERIREAATDGLNLSTDVSKAFEELDQLIGQVRLAVSATQGKTEQEILAAKRAKMEQDNKRREEAKKKDQEQLEKEMEHTRELAKRAREASASLSQERTQEPTGLWDWFFGGYSKKKDIERIDATVKEAESRLKSLKEAALRAEKEMKEISLENIKILENMDITTKDISTHEMIKLLNDGTTHLVELQKNWSGMTQYFKYINSYIDTVMHKQLINFANDANDARECNSILNSITMTINKSLQTSIESHRTAVTYVEVSNRYIIEPLNCMHKMLAIKPGDVDSEQKKLKEFCIKASEGIVVICEFERTKTIQNIEKAIESSKKIRSIGN